MYLPLENYPEPKTEAELWDPGVPHDKPLNDEEASRLTRVEKGGWLCGGSEELAQKGGSSWYKMVSRGAAAGVRGGAPESFPCKRTLGKEIICPRGESTGWCRKEKKRFFYISVSLKQQKIS